MSRLVSYAISQSSSQTVNHSVRQTVRQSGDQDLSQVSHNHSGDRLDRYLSHTES